MKSDEKEIINILIRYSILVILAFVGLELFYYIFLPLTKHPIFYVLSLFHYSVVRENTIYIGKYTIEIVGACIAGSAYYLLLILNLSTGKTSWIDRLKLFLFSFGMFFVINLIRIYVLSVMYLNDSPIFDATHKLFWYFGSTIFVVLIWFFGTYLFKIKSTPFYTDIKNLYLYTKMKNERKNKLNLIKNGSEEAKKLRKIRNNSRIKLSSKKVISKKEIKKKN